MTPIQPPSNPPNPNQHHGTYRPDQVPCVNPDDEHAPGLRRWFVGTEHGPLCTVYATDAPHAVQIAHDAAPIPGFVPDIETTVATAATIRTLTSNPQAGYIALPKESDGTQMITKAWAREIDHRPEHQS